MPSKLNAVWHKANRMRANASLEQRIAWHLAHARGCACRSIPDGILKELARRGIKLPSGRRA